MTRTRTAVKLNSGGSKIGSNDTCWNRAVKPRRFLGFERKRETHLTPDETEFFRSKQALRRKGHTQEGIPATRSVGLRPDARGSDPSRPDAPDRARSKCSPERRLNSQEPSPFGAWFQSSDLERFRFRIRPKIRSSIRETFRAFDCALTNFRPFAPLRQRTDWGI